VEALLDGIRGRNGLCRGSFLDGLDLVLGELIMCFELGMPSCKVTFDKSEDTGFRLWRDTTVQWGGLHGRVAITEAHTALMMLIPADICSGSLVHNSRAMERKIGLVLGSSHA